MLSKLASSSDPHNMPLSLSVMQSRCPVARSRNERAFRFFVRGRAGTMPEVEVSSRNARSLRDAWQNLEASENAACAGIVWRSPQDADVLADLIADGFAGEVLPGAIAVYSRPAGFLLRLSDIVAEQASPFSMRLKSGIDIPFEWPPILVVTDAQDPELLTDLRVCQRLKELGIPVELHVHDDVIAMDDHLPNLVEDFFQRNLLKHFPKML